MLPCGDEREKGDERESLFKDGIIIFQEICVGYCYIVKSKISIRRIIYFHNKLFLD